jgi:RNA polymerase sigma-70 factor (ECF subfamily)
MSTKSDAKRSKFDQEALIHLDSLLRTALYLTGDETLSNDLIQEIYLRAYRRRDASKERTDWRAWLFKTLVGLIGEYQLSAESSAEKANTGGNGNAKANGEPAFLTAVDNFTDDMCHDVDDTMIKDAIRELPIDVRLPVILSFLEGFSYRQIAKMADIDMETVKTRLMKGRRLLQEILWNRMVQQGLMKIYPGCC